MQKDMHYYGVYAMARAAGMRVGPAEIVATASEYVDDAIWDSGGHDLSRSSLFALELCAGGRRQES